MDAELKNECVTNISKIKTQLYDWNILELDHKTTLM